VKPWKGKKIPVAGVPVRNLKREPRLAIDADNAAKGTPIWRFGLIDLNGPWHWNLDAATMHAIRDKLVSFESMTWSEIESKRHHFLSAEGLSSGAKKRLAEIRQDDAADLLFSFACSAVERLVGIRTGREFRILWWDSKHDVYPSTKRNT
jgi:hypothetical protein